MLQEVARFHDIAIFTTCTGTLQLHFSEIKDYIDGYLNKNRETIKWDYYRNRIGA